jgi:hypothetical protein
LKYCAYYDYFDGNQPLRYSTERLKDAFQQIRPKFRQNWCAVVINSVLDRMELYGWNVADEGMNAILSDAWAETGLSLESNEVHESALVCGESFLIGWKEEGQPIEFYFNDPRRAAWFYDSDRPKVKTYADFRRVWAKVDHTVDEQVSLGNLEAANVIYLTIYKVPQLDTRWRVIIGEDAWEITAIDSLDRLSPVYRLTLRSISKR